MQTIRGGPKNVSISVFFYGGENPKIGKKKNKKKKKKKFNRRNQIGVYSYLFLGLFAGTTEHPSTAFCNSVPPLLPFFPAIIFFIFSFPPRFLPSPSPFFSLPSLLPPPKEIIKPYLLLQGSVLPAVLVLVPG